MIESLSASMGLAASDPLFWLPLALMAVVTLLLLGLVLLDGVALGAGLLLPWVGGEQRAGVLVAMAPWQRASERWLPLFLGVSMAAFPLAWSVMIEGLYAPFLMLVVGALLRSMAMRLGPCVWIYAIGSALGALGFGLLLAAYVTGLNFHWSFVGFVLLLCVSMFAVFALLAASWLLLSVQGTLAARLSRLASAAARWSAAGMVALSFMLALANPAIFYKWTHGNHVETAALWWLVMLVAFVWLDRLLRGWPNRTDAPVRTPVLLTWLLMLLMFAGLVYSIFPFLVLDELTLWDAAGSTESLSLVGVAAMIVAVVGVAAQGWDYRRFLGRDQLPEVA